MRLIYLSPVPWNSFSQRPHELIRYFHANTGGEVLWIDPYPTRLPELSDLIGSRPASAPIDSDIPDWLHVLKTTALPIEPLPFSGEINRVFWHGAFSCVDKFVQNSTVIGIGKPSELALQLLAKRKFISSFYDAMDDFPAFYTGLSSYAMARRERRIIRAVSTVLASSSFIWGRLKHLTSDVRLVLNACATERLPAVRGKRLASNDRFPVIGYVGTIAKWFDWELVRALASAHPLAKFRLIGPLYGKVPHSLPNNVFLEPPLSHADALQAMTQFDVAMIPFKLTPLTASVDPIKYYEYRALGLPILSSAFGEMAKRGISDGVCLIDRNSDFVKAIDKVRNMDLTTFSQARFRTDNSWKNRFDAANIFLHNE